MDAVARQGQYFIADHIQLYCVIPASYMHPDLNTPSPMDHSALTSDAVSRIPAGSVRRYSANTWTRGAVEGHCSLTPL